MIRTPKKAASMGQLLDFSRTFNIITKYAALAISKSLLMSYFDYISFVSTACNSKIMAKGQRLLNR